MLVSYLSLFSSPCASIYFLFSSLEVPVFGHPRALAPQERNARGGAQDTGTVVLTVLPFRFLGLSLFQVRPSDLLQLPLYQAELLLNHGKAKVKFPPFYEPGIIGSLTIDPLAVNLATHSLFYFELGLYLCKMYANSGQPPRATRFAAGNLGLFSGVRLGADAVSQFSLGRKRPTGFLILSSHLCVLGRHYTMRVVIACVHRVSPFM